MFKKVMAYILVIVICVVGFIALTFGLGEFSMAVKERFGVRSANIDRQIFEENKSHVKGVASDLADIKFQLTEQDDPVVRKALLELVRERYADFDANKLDNNNLRAFLLDVQEGRLRD